jgi:hypothetical protein
MARAYKYLIINSGTFTELFHRCYKTHCEEALNEFSRVYWPCEFSNNGERCINTRAGHAKGHQNKHGKIIGSGGYQSAFLFASFKEQWCKILEEQICQLTQPRKDTQNSRDITEETTTKKDHLMVIGQFYKDLPGTEKFRSHSICLCCLRGHPEYLLRCGHVLCIACIQSFCSNHEPENMTFKMMSCPLHEQDTDWKKQPWPITILPPLAGVRILCLDG